LAGKAGKAGLLENSPFFEFWLEKLENSIFSAHVSWKSWNFVHFQNVLLNQCWRIRGQF